MRSQQYRVPSNREISQDVFRQVLVSHQVVERRAHVFGIDHHMEGGTFSNGSPNGGAARALVSGDVADTQLDNRPASVALKYIIKW